MTPSKVLLQVVVCPISGSKLTYDEQNALLINQEGTVAYPVVEGVPMLLKSEAIYLHQTSDITTELLVTS